MFAPAQADAPLDTAASAQIEAHVARKLAAAARTATFVLYRVGGGQPVVAGYGGPDDHVDSVTLAFATPAGRVTVETDAAEPLEPLPWLARRAFEELLHERDAEWPAGTRTAMALWLTGRERAVAATAATATANDLLVCVDDVPTWFASVADGEQFAAAARIGGATVTITGPGDPARVALETIAPTAL